MKYKVLAKEIYKKDNYQLCSIRNEDKFHIMNWRNAQIDILRQKRKITKAEQTKYFGNVILPEFESDEPDQILFSFFKNGILIGYGGVVHISWQNERGELSFLLETARNQVTKIFEEDLTAFIWLIKLIFFKELNLRKLTTEAYDLRPYLIEILEKNNFIKEGVLQSHYKINNIFKDAFLHACFNPKY